MRQVARRLKDGRLELIEVPEPSPGPGTVLVAVHASVISAGTERATLEVARKGLLAKARARPDQAREVIERARREGVRSTVALVRQRLAELGPLGYSAAGEVVEAAPDVRGVRGGDRVAIAGAGIANHAELDVVPSLLTAPVPEGVSFQQAAFATLGAIAMHGFRRGEAGVGSTVAVIGLGLIGQLAVRIARAAGCRVLGVDLAPERLEAAASAGAEVALRDELGERWTGSADAVLICASASSDDPIRLAAGLARDRAPVVVVGDVPMEVPRAPYYEKELDLRLSRSYGPGRYDPDYELHGVDYPVGYVRWTERRNMEAFLDLVADGRFDPVELVSDRFAFDDAERAFEALTEGSGLAILLDYEREGDASAATASRAAALRPRLRPTGAPGFGLIGAGSFATSTVVPGLLGAGLAPRLVSSGGGLSAASAARQFGFAEAVPDPAEVIADPETQLVAIATRHDSHAELAAQALAAGKAVYVEKPLALDWDGLARVRAARESSGAPLVVGFNRRHSPHAEALRRLAGPRLMSFRVNAGRLPPGHWLNDSARGGGRLRGEGCHFVDFLCDQAGCDPVEVVARGFASDPDLPLAAADNFGLQLGFSDGSVGSLSYAADAPTAAGKERFETSTPGGFGVIEDFRDGVVWDGGRRRRIGRRRQDKGFDAQYAAIARIARGEGDPPPPETFYLSTLATLAALRSLETGRPEPVVEMPT